MAYLSKLYKEDSKLSIVEQECRRRLMLCIFTVDRLSAIGAPEYISTAAGLNVQLPCQERYFETDVAIRIEYLHDKYGSIS